MIVLMKIWPCFVLFNYMNGFEMSCNKSEYFDPSLMSCQMCPKNVSMVKSADECGCIAFQCCLEHLAPSIYQDSLLGKFCRGFSCVCEENSVPVGVSRCRQCNSTEVVSADGTACVPRKCQSSNGRFACRKCPSDYILVTQNLDGSPTKEVLCVKCARGYKAQNNTCVKCAACVCSKAEVAVKGACVTKRFLSERPRYEGSMPATALMEVVKNEYLCIKGDLLSCRTLAAGCVQNFYSSDAAGACRLWLQPKIAPPRGLPELVIVPTAGDISPGEFVLPHGVDSLLFILTVYTHEGGFKIFQSIKEKKYPCFLPVEVNIGTDVPYDCDMNITDLISLDKNCTYSVYLNMGGRLKPVPISIRKPGDYFVKRGSWSSSHFRRLFLIGYLTTSSNLTSMVYLRSLVLKIQIERDSRMASSLRVAIRIEAQYSTKTSLSPVVTTSLRVEHDMPSAGIRRGLEIWGGVLGSLLSLYAVAQWRGEMRRGGIHFSLLPLLAGYLADALYFSVWFSTLHALAAEAGTLGITLPLSRGEEHFIRAFVYSTIVLKAINIAWLNWKQCSCDLFFLDWNEYNPSYTDGTLNNRSDWRVKTLAREWSGMQTLRRVPPSYTAVMTLIMLHLMTPWLAHIGQSRGYRWAAACIAWWASYGTLLACRWVLDRVVAPPPAVLPRVCRAVGLSLLVFQEEYYAHYIHGRSDDNKDMRMMAGPLSMCRIAMAPQLRIVYNQLSSINSDDTDAMAKQALLSKLLAAFFERALDGLNWVASERTMIERLLDVELAERESGTTSVLLYDPADTTPSCVALTWWGEEWSLGSFDAMLFGLVVLTTDEPLFAGLLTVTTWKIMQRLRHWFGERNQKKQTNVDTTM